MGILWAHTGAIGCIELTSYHETVRLNLFLLTNPLTLTNSTCMYVHIPPHLHSQLSVEYPPTRLLVRMKMNSEGWPVQWTSANVWPSPSSGTAVPIWPVVLASDWRLCSLCRAGKTVDEGITTTVEASQR